jgi:hypothetical protein
MLGRVFVHRSPCSLRIGTKLQHQGKNYDVSSAVETILESQRLGNFIPRNEAVYASETNGGNHGLTYNDPVFYWVLMCGKLEKRDSKWLGELQKRHHANPDIRSLSDATLMQLKDDEIADKYWNGIGSAFPNWEIVARTAYVLFRAKPPSPA